MVGVGEYHEEVKNPKNNLYKLNTEYNSFLNYIRDLRNGELLGLVPYDIIQSNRIISCKYVDVVMKKEVLLISTVKYKLYDKSSRY